MSVLRLEMGSGFDSISAQFEEAVVESFYGDGEPVAAIIGAYNDRLEELVVLKVKDSYLRDDNGDISLGIFHNLCAMFLGHDLRQFLGLGILLDDGNLAVIQSTQFRTIAYRQTAAQGVYGRKHKIEAGSRAWDFYAPIYARLKLLT